MRRYFITTEIEHAEGWQSWSVIASTPEEAMEKYKNGDYEFDDESVEVTSLSDGELSKYFEELD